MPQPKRQAQTQKAKKKGKGPLAAIVAVLIVVVAVFAGIGVGIIPRFWESGQNSDSASSAPGTEYIDEKNGEKLKDVSGKTVNEATEILEDQGFKVGNVVTRYSYAADSEGKVAYTEPIAGTKLKDDAPVDLIVIKQVDVYKAREYAINKFKTSARLSDDPSFLEGTWTAEHIDVDLSNNYRSNCDAWENVPGEVTITISKVNAKSGSVDVTAIDNVPLHAHNNDTNAMRHYNSKDDLFSGAGNTATDLLAGSNTAVFTVKAQEYANNWDQDLIHYAVALNVPTGEKDNNGKDRTKELDVVVIVRMNTDVDLNDSNSIADLLGDDLATIYESEEDAYEALATALKDSSWVELLVSEGYDSYNPNRYENFKLTKKE